MNEMSPGPAARFYSDAPATGFDTMPELAGFRLEPSGMYVGCPGKHGYLKLVFEDCQGKTILRDKDRRAPLIVQNAMYFDEQMPQIACVYIQSSGGPNVDGDRYVQEFILRRNAMAHISTGAATKLAEMQHNYSGMRQSMLLEAGAYLEYLPEPVIPCRHTRYISDTAITIDASAALFYAEIYMPGRKYYGQGESFEYDVLSICAHARRPSGEKLFREKFIIRPQDGHVRDLGVMGRFDVFANAVLLCPPEAAEKIYALIQPVWDADKGLAHGASRLPNDCGLIFKALGMEPGPVKKLVRNFCSTARQILKGAPLPEEFPWR